MFFFCGKGVVFRWVFRQLHRLIFCVSAVGYLIPGPVSYSQTRELHVLTDFPPRYIAIFSELHIES